MKSENFDYDSLLDVASALTRYSNQLDTWPDPHLCERGATSLNRCLMLLQPVSQILTGTEFLTSEIISLRFVLTHMRDELDDIHSIIQGAENTKIIWAMTASELYNDVDSRTEELQSATNALRNMRTSQRKCEYSNILALLHELFDALEQLTTMFKMPVETPSPPIPRHHHVLRLSTHTSHQTHSHINRPWRPN